MAKPGRFRRAMTALKKLIADKEDTKQVFIILEAWLAILACGLGDASKKRRPPRRYYRLTAR